MSHRPETWRNHLLASLPTEDWNRWQKILEPIHFQAGDVVYEVGETIRYVYFPTTTILSVTQLLREGGTVEVAMIGAEGMSGISIFMGDGVSTQRVVALRPGDAYRVKTSWISNELRNVHPLMHHILRFTQSLITQMSQIGACNHHHPLEQQFSRWLLFYADRANSNLVTCTQETIANMLGVRRERMAKAANNLQKIGLIQYSRGKIKLIDRLMLEQHTCECYATVKSVYSRLSPLVRLI
jgi:CRP-like cAMP-binding protein